MDDPSSDDSSPTRPFPVTRRRLLGTGVGIASALGIGAGVPQKVQASGGVSPDDADSDTVGGVYAVATDTDGSSEDSRVTLGTRGHHHAWANTSPSELHFDEAAAGTQRWRFNPHDHAYSPTIVDGTIFVSSGNTMYALDAETADEQWRFTTEGSINRRLTTAPQVVGGTVFVGAYDYVYAIDAETGDEQWYFETGDVVWSSPTARNGRVFVGSDDTNLYALDTETGDEQWRFETEGAVEKSPGAVEKSPAVIDGTVFVHSRDTNLYALDMETGDEQWRFETSPHTFSGVSGPAVADGTVYVGAMDPTLYALDTETGEERWTFEAEEDAAFASLPTVADGTVYVRSSARHEKLLAIDQDSGEKQWDSEIRVFGPTPAFPVSSPTVVDDSIFIGNRDGYVLALERATGEEQWRFEIGEGVNSPTVVDGTLFFGTIHSDPEIGTDPKPHPFPEPEPSNGGHSPSEPEPEDQPGFGIVSTLTALGGVGYLLKRRVLNDEKRTR